MWQGSKSKRVFGCVINWEDKGWKLKRPRPLSKRERARVALGCCGHIAFHRTRGVVSCGIEFGGGGLCNVLFQ